MAKKTGRPKQHNNLKKLRGTSQPCRMSDKDNIEGLQPLSKVSSPSWLSLEGKRIFRTKSRQLISVQILTDLDVDQLAIYSNSYAEAIVAIQALQEEGRVISKYSAKGDFIGKEVNPHHKLYQDHIKIVNQIGGQFGFSPSSRATILASLPKKDTPKGDFDDFINI